MATIPVTPRGVAPRIRVFVDYWNLQLTLNTREEEAFGQQNVRFKIDWRGLPAWLARKASEAMQIPTYSFEGAIIFASYNPNSADGRTGTPRRGRAR